jgi:2-polyprenyl-6-methoxyphenol hydroxylase-like FAD-dependent oxidoreductase
MNAAIIGAGIAGPVAAMALARAGIRSTIYESRGPTGADVGSYLTVATNGLDALRAIDAHEPVIKAGFPTGRSALFSGTGRRLAAVPIGSTAHACGPSITIKRARLHRALHEEALRRNVSFSLVRD